ncbi:putative PurR-regulated permease PerM [Mycolicibacterium sp. BK556]|uniref:AI-2E family transporter n=1 Tax=unclassified Mycolicibacterium TaxID=2636767 RepID=UPI001614847F|nr:putative PurR-regulated permease PerM [Mycolicibacterium sp. BK556]MBB3635853.1 putative PurR-regulated permease PerM [Mycolicibacterium sp. BK607]
MNTEFTLTQKRALAIITLLALVLGAYFLRHYFILVVIAAIVAYLFTPLYNRCRQRFGSGLSATLTVLAALATVIIPVGALLTLAVLQISHMVIHVADWVETADMSTVGNNALEYVNQALAKLPFGHFAVSTDSLRDTMISVSQNLGRWALHALQGAAGGVIGVVTSAIIFLYVLVSLMTNQQQLLLLIRRLNPLGEEVTDLYLAKMGAMVKGTVKGQFIIALVQGVLGAASIYIGGFHQGFFIFAIFLTALSVIPLGSGIITIPFGIGMMFFGNIGGGLFVVLFHIIGVTNVDNFLRPILVPREARLDPALMLLAVFSGIAMFGFWGIVLGPVLMIIIVTTISVYLAVYKGVEMTSHEPPEKRRRTFRRRLRAEADATAAAADGEPSEG